MTKIPIENIMSTAGNLHQIELAMRASGQESQEDILSIVEARAVLDKIIKQVF